MNYEDEMKNVNSRIDSLSLAIDNIQSTEKDMERNMMFSEMAGAIKAIETRQEETIKLVNGIKAELAGISAGMARRNSILMGQRQTSQESSNSSGSHFLGRDSRSNSLTPRSNSLTGDLLRSTLHSQSRRCSYDSLGGGFIPELEVEPWEPSPDVQVMIDRLLERQFLLFPWVREKRLRNQLRLILKDCLDAGPKRRSTVTKIVHDAHQLFPIWRNQTREIMLDNWEKLNDTLGCPPEEAAKLIFSKFKVPRFPDEMESMLMFAEHMVEVAQYLSGKFIERSKRSGKASIPTGVPNSKFWFEVRKKVTDILESKKAVTDRRRSSAFSWLSVDGPSDGEEFDDVIKDLKSNEKPRPSNRRQLSEETDVSEPDIHEMDELEDSMDENNKHQEADAPLKK